MLMTYHKAFPAFGIPVLDYSGNQKGICPSGQVPLLGILE